MPLQSSPSADAIVGTGLVRLRNGDAHEGAYVIHGPWVSLTGRRRNVQAGGEVLYGQAATWTWPARCIEVITESAQVAA